jgi:signal transduction histidine kinase
MVINQDIPDNDREKFNEIINRSSVQLLSMIDDILNVASIEAGEVAIRKKKVDINMVLDLISTQFRFKAENNNVEIRVHHPHGDANPTLPTRRSSFRYLPILRATRLNLPGMGRLLFRATIRPTLTCLRLRIPVLG